MEFAAAGVTADAFDGVVWLPPDAWMARYVPPEASRADARTALEDEPRTDRATLRVGGSVGARGSRTGRRREGRERVRTPALHWTWAPRRRAR